MVKAQICSLLSQWFWTSSWIFLNLFLYSRERYRNITYFTQFLKGQVTISKVLPQCLLYEKHAPDQVLASLFLQWPHQLCSSFQPCLCSHGTWANWKLYLANGGIAWTQVYKELKNLNLKSGFQDGGFWGLCVQVHMPVNTRRCIQALTHTHVQRSEDRLQELVLCWIYDRDFDLLSNWWLWMDSLLVVALVMLLTRWTSRSPIYTHKPTETFESPTFKTNKETAN